MIRNYIAFGILSLYVTISTVNAQGIMSFKEETHDFKNIQEGTIATYEFEFTNTGDQPIVIELVKASCGCTTPSWTKEPVMQGKKGYIKASFNSAGKGGEAFHKSVTVNSNAKKTVATLYIKGYVQPSAATLKQGEVYNQTQKTAADLAPPVIQLDKYAHDFGKVEIGQKVKERFTIYNGGENVLIIKGLENKCTCISFGLSQGVVPAGKTVMLEITLDAKEIQLLDEPFKILTNDPDHPEKIIQLKAEVFENFTNHLFKDKNNFPFEK
jgi:hypothetical protein